MMNENQKKLGIAMLTGVVAYVLPNTAYAAGLPWESPLTMIQTSLAGPVAKSFAIIGIIGGGIAMFFGEGGPAGKFLARGVFGIGIALGAASLISSLF